MRAYMSHEWIRYSARKRNERKTKQEGRLATIDMCPLWRPRMSFFRSSLLSAFASRACDIARGNRLSHLEKFQKGGKNAYANSSQIRLFPFRSRFNLITDQGSVVDSISLSLSRLLSLSSHTQILSLLRFRQPEVSYRRLLRV